MPQAIRTPRVNNNDDVVKLSHVFVEIGAKVRTGDPLLDVETDKATFTLESELDGYLLAVNADVGDMIPVGSVVAWLGSTPDEVLLEAACGEAAPAAAKEPSLKALLLLKQHNLQAADIRHSGPAITAEDVRRQLAGNGARAATPSRALENKTSLPGRAVPFTPEERGMCRTVSWQRDHAATAYLDISYDPEPWLVYSSTFQKTHGLWYDPLLALMAWRLVRLASEYPRINATVSGDAAFLYNSVNLGFTVQVDSVLYLIVVKDARNMDQDAFVRALSSLQLSAMRRALTPDQTSEATLSFSSMARWNVRRHMPILPPETAMIVAHTAPDHGTAHLGATYDHRLLTGFDVVRVLQAIVIPPEASA
jgi:pyruvate/2-oxoglutarate dehydrogenase complex dihydrolipoamide acyltransferase (E2) component